MRKFFLLLILFSILVLVKNEKQAKEILIDFDQAHPGELKGENINVILELARQKRKKDDMER